LPIWGISPFPGKKKYSSRYWKESDTDYYSYLLDSYSYNKSQQDALVLNFILVNNSTCYGETLSIIRSLNTVFTAIGTCHVSYGLFIVIYSYNKSQQDALFLNFIFVKQLCMFRTDLLSIIRSLNTVFIAIGICHNSYVDCLLTRSGGHIGPGTVQSTTELN
jgi:hypothetical protein